MAAGDPGPDGASGPGGLVPGSRASIALFAFGVVVAVVVDVLWWSSTVSPIFSLLFTAFSILVVGVNFQLLVRGRQPFRRG